MKDQVTSIEQSKRLIELGVPADRASMVYRKTNVVGIVRLEVKNGKGGIVAPAFTVADLLILLSDMAEKCGVSIRIHQEVGSICYTVYVDDCLIFPYEERSFVDMLVQGIIYLEPKYSKCYKS